MPITKQELEDTIRLALPNAIIETQDLAGDNDHWAVSVTDISFAGMPRLAQHRKVQDAVANKNIHALQIKTAIPN